MPQIINLSPIGEVLPGDSLPIFDESNGDTRRMSVAQMQTYMQNNLNMPDNSDEVNFLQAGTGAVTRTVQSKLRETVSAKDFGATGDGVTDDTAALQAAINHAMETGNTLLINSGIYVISSPLLIMRFSGGAYSYSGINIEGECVPYDYDTLGPFRRAVIFKKTFNNRPGVIIQNGRAVSIKNICVIGTNAVRSYILPDYSRIMSPASFNRDSSRDSQYSPDCGFCIDPFGTSVPPDGGYPGMSSYYAASAAGSSYVTLVNCYTRDVLIGYMVTPNQTTQNAENIKFDFCIANYTKVGIAIGQSQSRNVSCFGCNIGFAYYCIDSVSYGAKTGTCPYVNSMNMAGKYLFNVSSVWGNSVEIENIYAESFSSIGFFGSNASSQAPFVFNGCTFDFASWDTTGSSRIYADQHLIAYGPMVFNGCMFNQSTAAEAGPIRMWHSAVGPLTFQSCSFMHDFAGLLEPTIAPSCGVDATEWESFWLFDCYVDDSGGRGNNAGRSLISHRLGGFDMTFNNAGGNLLPMKGEIKIASDSTSVYYNAQSNNGNKISLGSRAVTLGSNGTATFVPTDPDVVRTGDLVYAAVSSSAFDGPTGSATFNPGFLCIGIVSVTGATVTITGVPQNLPAGTYTLYVEWISRIHPAGTCTTVSGSNVINSVTSATTFWKVGNRIAGAGIPTGAYITAISGTDITLSKNATASASGVRIYDANLYKLTGTAV